MSVTINIYYSGKEGNAKAFAEEMIQRGIVDRIRAEKGNIRYEYFLPLDKNDTVLLIDSWKDEKALDVHHASPMMSEIAELREKYDLHMTVEKYVENKESLDESYIRK